MAGADPAIASAQSASLWLDAAASSARPPAGITGHTTLYGLLGGRAELLTATAGDFNLSGRGGWGQRVEGSRGARWGEGEGAWEIGRAVAHFGWGVRTSAFLLSYASPFEYRALGAGVAPRVSLGTGGSIYTLTGDFRGGSWSRPLMPPPTDTTLPVIDSARSGALAVAGGAIAAARLIGPAWLQGGVEAYRGALDGWFRGVTAAAALSRGRYDLGFSARLWRTPVETEFGFGASFDVPASAVGSLHLDVGRSTRDPLYGTPGSFAASAAVSLRLAHFGHAGRRHPLVELGDTAGDGRRARFRLRLPRARLVALAGDFTDWRPQPMLHVGDDWIAEMNLPHGVHHFAFLVNGQSWFVPPGAPGVSDDEWGRRNATIIVEP